MSRTAISQPCWLPLLLAATLVACTRDDPEADPVHIDGLHTFQVQAAEAADGHAWEGVVQAVRQATLTAQTNGRVVTVLRDVNDHVAAGEVLVRLSAMEQQSGVDAARAHVRATEATATEAEANYRRFADLAKDQFVSRAQLDQARMARDSATAARDAARAQLQNAGQQTDYTTIRAPYAGIVATRDVEPGESIGIGQTLMTVFAPDALRIEVTVPQSEADAIRTNPVAAVTLADGRQINADNVTVFPAADASTHAVGIRVQLPSLDAPPQPGLTAKVAFPAVKGTAFPRVPTRTLVRRGEVTAVYVLSDGRPSLRQVRLGDVAGDQVNVISGLKPGDRVATDPIAAQQALVEARKGG